MTSPPHFTRPRRKVRRLTWLCLLAWLGVTLAPVLLVWMPGLKLGPWPLDFWMAAQGSVLAYLVIVGVYAWQVNRREREADATPQQEGPDQGV